MSGAMNAAEQVTAKATGPESLSAESRATAARLAESYRVSPRHGAQPQPAAGRKHRGGCRSHPERPLRSARLAFRGRRRAPQRPGPRPRRQPRTLRGRGVPAVRIHSECATGDIFGSFRCDCGPQLENGLRIIGRTGGYLVYVRNHEGRGIGLVNKPAPTPCRTPGSTPSTRTSPSAWTATCATTRRRR